MRYDNAPARDGMNPWIPLTIGVVGIGVMAALLPKPAEAKSTKSTSKRRKRNPYKSSVKKRR